MTKKHFGPKNLKCWSYWAKAGSGWEVGFTFQGKTLFVGNFIHHKEATQWYSMMNKEITTFSKKYTFGPKFPVAFFKKFIVSHLYATYYTHLDKVFTQYTRTYKKAQATNKYQYANLKKKWTPKEATPFYKAA